MPVTGGRRVPGRRYARRTAPLPAARGRRTARRRLTEGSPRRVRFRPALRRAEGPCAATERDLPESADRPATRDCCRRARGGASDRVQVLPEAPPEDARPGAHPMTAPVERTFRLTSGGPHDVSRRLRDRPAAAGHPAPPRPRNDTPHTHQQGRAPLRRRAVGQARPRRARRVRRCPAGPRSARAPPGGPAHRDVGRHRGAAARAGPGLRRTRVRHPRHRPAPHVLRLTGAGRPDRLPHRRRHEGGTARAHGPDTERTTARHGARRLPPRAAAQPSVHPRHLVLGVRRRERQPDEQTGTPP